LKLRLTNKPVFHPVDTSNSLHLSLKTRLFFLIFSRSKCFDFFQCTKNMFV
jgi:hypothetical protein